jgi:hypothetical protein
MKTSLLTENNGSVLRLYYATHERGKVVQAIPLEILFGRCPIRILAGLFTILIKVCCGFPQSFKVNGCAVFEVGHDRNLFYPWQFIARK